MTKLTVSTYKMPAANLGPQNPLPAFYGAANRDELKRLGNLGQGWPDSGNEQRTLPYRLYDGYDRARNSRDFKSLVLENDILRATFLPELGGRLWSLFHKPTNRELLHVNPVFQPANLAARDAWFSGGVEWNISIIGHTPLTCEPLFAARVQGEDGSPILRFWEFERIRRVAYQMDFILPEKSPYLYVRVRICNPHDFTIPMYWYSNIACDEREGDRVLGPADKGIRHDSNDKLVDQDVPILDGVDISYPTNRRDSSDMYFNIPAGRRPWIAALDKSGAGLVQTSTDRLLGRKVWAWGMRQGARRWQDFLAAPGHAYIEIQGGLTRTQAEYIGMPAHAQWEWMEAYGLLQAEPKRVHSSDWTDATNSVEEKLESTLPRKSLESLLERTRRAADSPPLEILHYGAGWGALEQMRRVKAVESILPTSPSIPFPVDAMKSEEKPWLTLLKDGALPSRKVTEEPGAFMVQPEWHALLEDAVKNGRGDHWLSWFHLGVMRYRANDVSGASSAWNESVKRESNPWALRNLAVLADDEADLQKAADLYLQAARMAPHLLPLARECATALTKAARWQDAIGFLDSLPADVKANGRIRFLRAWSALQVDDLKTVEEFFDRDFDMPNVREREVAATDLWFGWHEKLQAAKLGRAIDDDLRKKVRHEFPPPSAFDFRMIQERAERD